MRQIYFLTLMISWAAACLTACNTSLPEPVEEEYASLPDQIDYNFHVKPILSDRCYQCHGPDENSRKANLRLDIEELAFSTLASGKSAFVKGSPGRSEAFHRMISADDEYRMPPPESKLTLTAREIAIITKWIEQGAEWKPHWSFLPVNRPDVPEPVASWPATNEIDRFIQEKLEANGYTPAKEADKERLLRRVTMDLTGLPPTLTEMERFVNDTSPDAYEKVVDELIARESHGERLAMEWMDIARYADSHGVSFDGYRNVWPYRDWVIRAFNRNMPFDEFIKLQVAGDLKPNPTDDDLLATAFYRLNPMEASAGSIDEEYRVEYVTERTALTGTAFLGLTIGCAKCHDHKFDPVSQKEFYQLSAFFNNMDERGLGMTDANRAPTLLMFKNGDKKRLDSLEIKINGINESLSTRIEDLSGIHQFISTLEKNPIDAVPVQHYSFETLTPLERLPRRPDFKPFEPDPEAKKKKEKKKEKTAEEKKKELEEMKKNMQKVQVIDNNKDSEATINLTLGEGKKGKALVFNEDYDIAELRNAGEYALYEPFSVSLWINPEAREKEGLMTMIGNSGSFETDYRGWEFYLDKDHHLRLKMIHRLSDDYLEVSTKEPVSLNTWSQVGFTYDGSGRTAGVSLFINGQRMPLLTIADKLKRNILPLESYTIKEDTIPLRVGKSYRIWTGEQGVFKGRIDEISVYDSELTALQMAHIAGTTPSDKDKLTRLHQAANDIKVNGYKKQLSDLRKERLSILSKAEEVMIMQEREERRPTYLLERGVYNMYGQEVFPGTPEHILPFGEDLPDNRMGLAMWLTDEKNPLTARVTINRYWQMLFGKGIVGTSEDFGNQGNLPTHPELLDWLASEFVESGWNLRHMLKIMVMSHTYRQAIAASDFARENDPQNYYYSHANSYRWQAEMIRDNALAASGLLKQQLGGPSVKPYQPKGLWEDLGDFSYRLAVYYPDKGDSLYRRSLYTFVRRFMPAPFMINFDGSTREVCVPRRETTNTPLQALNLLNDPQFVEASRVLAERVQAMDDLPEKQIELAFRLSTGVSPTPKQVDILLKQYESMFDQFSKNPHMADSLCSIGEYPVNDHYQLPKTAALSMVVNTIFNFDETYMKR